MAEEVMAIFMDLDEGVDPRVLISPLHEKPLQSSAIPRYRKLWIDRLGNLYRASRAHTYRPDLRHPPISYLSILHGLILLCQSQSSGERACDLTGHVINKQNAPVLLRQRVKFLVEEPLANVGFQPARQERAICLQQGKLCKFAV